MLEIHMFRAMRLIASLHLEYAGSFFLNYSRCMMLVLNTGFP